MIYNNGTETYLKYMIFSLLIFNQFVFDFCSPGLHCKEKNTLFEPFSKQAPKHEASSSSIQNDDNDNKIDNDASSDNMSDLFPGIWLVSCKETWRTQSFS